MAILLTDVIVYLCSVLVLSLSWNIKGANCQLDVQFDVHNVVALRKEPAYMTCITSGQDARGNIFWFKDRQPIQDKNIQLFANGTLYFPMVRHKPTFSDSGTYQCCLKMNLSAICSNDVQLSIATMPKLSKNRINLKCEVGEAVRLTCPTSTAVPRPNITWYKDKEALLLDNSVTVLLSGVLHLLSVRLDQAARYRCQASNLAGQRNGPIITLNVTATTVPMSQPVVVSSPKDTQIVVGGFVELECLMEGPSNMIVTWTREDGKPIRNPTYTGRKNLVLANIVPEDAGTYVCSAQVPGTSTVARVSAKVEVISLPVIKTGPVNSLQKMRLTERLYCLIQANSATTVTWYKDGQLSQGDVNPTTNDLVLYNLKFEDAGIYQCLATNEAGSVQTSARLEVWSAPGMPAPPYRIRGVSTSASAIMVMWLVDQHPQNTIIATTINYKPVDGDQDSKRTEVIPELTTTYILMDLKPYTNYSIYLEVFTSQSSSLPSSTIYVITNEAEPTRYPDFQLSSSHPLSIDVSWEPLAKDQRNGVVTTYKIIYESSPTSAKEMIVNGTQLRATIRDLQPDTRYNIQMAVATKIGYGPSSDWTQFRTQDNLTALSPTVELYNITNTSVTLQWKPIGVVEIIGFNLNVSMSSNGKVLLQNTLSSQTQEFIVTALQPHAEYTIYVSVITNSGMGSPTILHVTTKHTVPISGQDSRVPWPRDIRINIVNYDSFGVQWKTPQTALLVNKYRLRYQSLNINDWEYMVIDKISGEDQEATVTNLQPFTFYRFSLQSIGVGIESGYSELYTVRTKAYKPQTPPADLRAKPIDAYSVQISWEPPQIPNGIITEYIILYNINNTSPEQQWDKQQRNGSETLSKVNNLLPNTEYFFRMKAKNHIGMSPATDIVSAWTLIAGIDETTAGVSSMLHGVLLGIGISVPCIVACIISLVLMKRLLGNGNRQAARHRTENAARDSVNCETAVMSTGTQPPRPVANYNHLIMYQNKQRQFGNNVYHVPCHANSAGGSSHDPDDEVPLSVRLLTGEFDNAHELLEESAQEVDPMLPRAGTIDGDIVEDDPIPLMANSMTSAEGVQTDVESGLEMQTTSEIAVDISSGEEENTSV